ncbi:MAG TPA: hypothetical protein VE935_13175, partial [Burkholderiales bacterium]|nr:hypothetical protein [Burkholderiales bacterium]
GALYLAGEDATGQLRFFKVDKGGVSDATGQGPFATGYVDHSVRERSTHYKQALPVTASNGTVTYKMLSVAMKTGRVDSLATVSYVVDPNTGAVRAKPGIAWIASSSEPTIGTFEFTLQLQGTSGRVATLLYTRRYVDANGQPAESTGIVNLPDPVSAGYTYNDFTGPVLSSLPGKLFVTADGTTIYPRGASGGTLSRQGVRITLSNPPTAELFDLPAGTSSSTFNSPSSVSTTIGTCSIDYIDRLPDGGPTFPATATSSKTRTEAVNKDNQTAISNTVYDGILNGKLLSYEQRFESRELDTSVGEACVAAKVDYGEDSPRVKVNLQGSKRVRLISHSEDTAVFSNGSLRFLSESVLAPTSQTLGVTCGLFGQAPAISTPFNSYPYSDFDYSYQGFGPCPGMAATVYTTADTSNEKKRLYRALTDRVEDAVYTDAADPGMVRFREYRIRPGTSSLSFVADTSPIGEVFLASPDLSILYHEPKPGNMPVLTREKIPSIVKLVAAIWM